MPTASSRRFLNKNCGSPFVGDPQFLCLCASFAAGFSVFPRCFSRLALEDPGEILTVQNADLRIPDFLAHASLTGFCPGFAQITADGIKSLQDALVQSQSLTHISFSQNDLGDDGCMQIIKALRNNRNITHVNLSDTGMSHNALTVLGALVGQIDRLKCLHVDNPHNGIDVAI